MKRKVAVVTGGAGGIGGAICGEFKKEGLFVVGIDLKRCNADDCIIADLSKEKEIERIINIIVEKFEHIDVLVNCAGITNVDWDTTIAVNLTAPYKLMSAMSKIMDSGGCVINIGSINANTALPGNPMYVASKGGLASLTRSFALDLGKKGIRVNCVHPGCIKTNMTKAGQRERYQEYCDRTMLGRWGEPNEVANVCLFLASEKASYITGTEIFVDGGWNGKA